MSGELEELRRQTGIMAEREAVRASGTVGAIVLVGGGMAGGPWWLVVPAAIVLAVAAYFGTKRQIRE